MSSQEPQGPLRQQLERLRSVRSLRDLTDRQRTVLSFAAGLVVVIAIHTVIYWIGMRVFETEPQSLSRSLVTVVETFSTVGYGGDSPWRSTFMNLYVVWLQVVSLGITFVTLRVRIVPLFERAPVVLDSRLTAKEDHTVVCGYERGGALLLDELDRADVEYVFVDPDKEEAIDLSNRDYQVIDGDPTTTEALSRASIADAAYVVTDADDRNVNVALTARQGNDDARIVSITGERSERPALEAVGVDRSIPAPAVVGRSLADRLTATVDSDGPAATLNDGDLVVRELVVRYDDALCERPIGETPVGTHPRDSPSSRRGSTANSGFHQRRPTGSRQARYSSSSGPRRRSTTRVNSGTSARRERMPISRSSASARADGRRSNTCRRTSRRRRSPRGTLGRRRRRGRGGRRHRLGHARRRGYQRRDGARRDRRRRRHRPDRRRARSLSSGIEIVVRVTDAESVRKAFDAGADYVFSERRVIARTVPADIDGRTTPSTTGPLRFVRAGGEAFAGRTLADGDGDRDRSADRDWLLVGVERDGRFRTDEGAEIEADDAVLVAGTNEGLERFEGDDWN